MALPDPKTPTRAQLFKLLGNHELVKLFEKLFEQAGDLIPSDVITLNRLVQEASIDANTADSKANQAIGGVVSNEIKTKSNGVLVWLSM